MLWLGLLKLGLLRLQLLRLGRLKLGILELTWACLKLPTDPQTHTNKALPDMS